VDLHRKRSHVVALDLTGEVVLSRRIGNAPAEFLRIFGELEPQPIEVVFEATYGWSWFADLLADVGIPAHMAHPLATKAISAARVIQRFPSPERLCSWAGLTPGERTSDAHTRRGHITKQGSRWLRWMLVEAATTAVRDPQLGRFTAQIARRRGPKIARVALARRPLTLC
jgi:Transposase IS116/IS110/IS902 family